jgi:hypothetical protein
METHFGKTSECFGHIVFFGQVLSEQDIHSSALNYERESRRYHLPRFCVSS